MEMESRFSFCSTTSPIKSRSSPAVIVTSILSASTESGFKGMTFFGSLIGILVDDAATSGIRFERSDVRETFLQALLGFVLGAQSIAGDLSKCQHCGCFCQRGRFIAQFDFICTVSDRTR